jgi:SAM-dependent methyltransferase
MNYRLAYAIGFHPWEDAAADPPFVAKATQMLDREERGRHSPYGRALDLGTGSAIWGIELAKRGWRVTGVDLVEKALRRAHIRVNSEGVEMKLVRGDVTALAARALATVSVLSSTREHSTGCNPKSRSRWGSASQPSPHLTQPCCSSCGQDGFGP